MGRGRVDGGEEENGEDQGEEEEGEGEEGGHWGVEWYWGGVAKKYLGDRGTLCLFFFWFCFLLIWFWIDCDELLL